MKRFYEKIVSRIQEHPRLVRILKVVQKSGFRWLEHGGPRFAAALAFYTAISLAPLLTIFVSILGFVYGDEAARGYLVEEIERLTDQRTAGFIKTVVADADQPARGVVASAVSIGVLLWGATRLFFQMQETLNIIWDARDNDGRVIVNAARQRLVSFAMMLVAAFLLLVSLLLNAALSYVLNSVRFTLPGKDWLWETANTGISLLMVWGLFATIYRVLPKKSVKWSHALTGAIVAAVLFSIGREFIGLYLARQDSAHAASGALMAVLLWVYFSAQIFYFGAEISKAVADTPKKVKQPPKNRASRGA